MLLCCKFNYLIFAFQYDHLNDVRRKFEETSSKQETLRAQFDPSALQARLKVAASQAEEESENIAEQFLSGKS